MTVQVTLYEGEKPVIVCMFKDSAFGSWRSPSGASVYGNLVDLNFPIAPKPHVLTRVKTKMFTVQLAKPIYAQAGEHVSFPAGALTMTFE